MKIGQLKKVLMDAYNGLEGYEDGAEVYMQSNTYFVNKARYFLGVSGEGYLDLNDIEVKESETAFEDSCQELADSSGMEVSFFEKVIDQNNECEDNAELAAAIIKALRRKSGDPILSVSQVKRILDKHFGPDAGKKGLFESILQNKKTTLREGASEQKKKALAFLNWAEGAYEEKDITKRDCMRWLKSEGLDTSKAGALYNFIETSWFPPHASDRDSDEKSNRENVERILSPAGSRDSRMGMMIRVNSRGFDETSGRGFSTPFFSKYPETINKDLRSLAGRGPFDVVVDIGTDDEQTFEVDDINQVRKIIKSSFKGEI